MVNRVWHYHFGRGIVATPNDFGFNGERPSHPELLDWLASEFIAQGWSVKKLHKLILLSATYQQCSAYQPPARPNGRRRPLAVAFRAAAAGRRGGARRHAVGQRPAEPQMGGPSFRPFTRRPFSTRPSTR